MTGSARASTNAGIATPMAFAALPVLDRQLREASSLDEEHRSGYDGQPFRTRVSHRRKGRVAAAPKSPAIRNMALTAAYFMFNSSEDAVGAAEDGWRDRDAE